MKWSIIKDMLSVIWDFLKVNAPQVAVYFVVGVFLIYFTVKITSFYKDTKKANGEASSMQKLLLKIDKGLSTLNNVLMEKTVISQSCYSSENSPRVLNSEGEKLFSESGAEELLKARKEEWISELEKQRFDSFLELERECLNFLLGKMTEKAFSGLQDFAYQHPTFEERPLTYSDILFVTALKLRDSYIGKHPEILERLKEKDSE